MRAAIGIVVLLLTADVSQADSIVGKTIRYKWTEYAQPHNGSPTKVRPYEGTVYVSSESNVYDFTGARSGQRFGNGESQALADYPAASGQHRVSGSTLTRVYTGRSAITTINYIATSARSCTVTMDVRAVDGGSMGHDYTVKVQSCRLSDGPPREAKR